MAVKWRILCPKIICLVFQVLTKHSGAATFFSIQVLTNQWAATYFSPCRKQLEPYLDSSPLCQYSNILYVMYRSMGECQGTAMISKLIRIMGVATTHGV